MTDKQKAIRYWRTNLKYLVWLIGITLLSAFGCSIWFKDALDSIYLGGFKLGFWFAQQGSIYLFLIVIFTYQYLMNKLDKQYGYDD